MSNTNKRKTPQASAKFTHTQSGRAAGHGVGTARSTKPAFEGAPTSSQASVLIRDPASRLYLLTRLIAAIEEADQRQLAQLLGSGFTPDLMEKLRSMSLTEAVSFTSNNCGFSLTVDARMVRNQLASLETAREVRQLYEYFVCQGASPRLLTSLFKVGPTEARRMRKMLVPQIVMGGRPRTPQEPLRSAVRASWDAICRVEQSERKRYWLLHQEFKDELIASLEAVVGPDQDGLDENIPPHAVVRQVTFGAPRSAQPDR